MMPFIKVWSMDHSEKKIVSLNEITIEELLLKANAKGIAGSRIFLLDGTEIDETEALVQYKDSPVVIGDENKVLTARRHSTDSATTSTLTNLSLSPSSVKSNNDFAFAIPYEKFPNSLLCKLNDDLPIGNSALVRIVVEELIHVNPYPNRSMYRVVARELCERYPSLYDRDEDTKELIGSGYYSVFKKIEERVHYLQRPNRVFKNRTKKNKQIKTLSAGCKEWEPDFPKEETLESLSEKQLWLQTVANVKERNENKVENYMEVTFSFTRRSINSTSSILIILEEWPILFEPKYLINHFEKLCGVNSSECIVTFQKKKPIIIEKLKQILKTENTVEGIDEELQFLQLVGQYFKEDMTVVFNALQDITKTEVTQLSKTPSPSITSVITGTKRIYYLVIEKRVICEVSDFNDSIKILCAAYYVFNMAYPPEGQCFLEFIQRYIFKINPVDGSKVKKTTKQQKGNIFSKVLSLMTKLRE